MYLYIVEIVELNSRLFSKLSIPSMFNSINCDAIHLFLKETTSKLIYLLYNLQWSFKAASEN